MTSRFSSTAVPSAVLLACLALAGCGGSSSTASNSSTIAGAVIDGYIEGATVCLDTNANQACDAGEPTATTAKDGSYKLDTSALTAAQIKAAHLLTVVPDTAKDADDDGKTLAQAEKKAFSLLAPAAAYVSADGSAVTGAVISPLTTLISHDMIASGTVIATAKSNVRSRLALPEGTDLTQDFVAKQDTSLRQTAQMLTVAIGEVKAAALADTSKPSDKQALFAALDYLQTQVADLKAAFETAKAANASAKPAELVKKALTTEAAKPDTASSLAEAKKTTTAPASASALVALIEQGLYGGDRVLEACSTLTPGASGYCTPYYWKVQGSGGKITLDNDFQLVNGAWQKDSDNGRYDWDLTSKGWKQENGCATGENATYSTGSDGVTTVTFCSGVTERVTARSVDASGKTLAELGLNPPAAFEKTTLPAGSQLNWLSFANTEDRYNLYTGYEPGKWVSSGANQPAVKQPFSTLDSFIAAYTQPSGGPSSSYIQQWSGLFFSFAANNSLTIWDSATAYTATPKQIGTGSYTRRTVHGADVITINTQAPQNSKGRLIMFAVKDGKVYGGNYRSAAVMQQSEGMFNKTMMDAILKAGNKPAVLN